MRNREWLVDELVRLALRGRRLEPPQKDPPEPVAAPNLDPDGLKAFLDTYRDYTRDRLARDGIVSTDAPPKGGDLLEPRHRSPEGEALLAHAKDMLHALLFGTGLERRQRELLTLVVPQAKSDALSFLRARTEFSALGVWRDPRGLANDDRARNVVIQVEYGEIDGEVVGDALVVALALINHLEINEEVLYGRMENVEQSTLVS